jgi:hypothetical protein
MQLFQAHANKLDDLARFLQAANPRPPGYASLAEICALVNPSNKPSVDINDVAWAIDEAKTHAQGKGYIEHIVKRLKEGVAKADIKTDATGYKEWLLVSTNNWGHVDITSSPNAAGGPGAWTGIFKVTINGTPIEVHNHFVQDGKQFSLHLKRGVSTFSKGPELTPKDQSAYQTISAKCLNAYTAFVRGRWATYTIPLN